MAFQPSAFQNNAFQVSTNITILPDVLVLISASHDPTICLDVVLTPSVQALTLEQYSPFVIAGVSETIIPASSNILIELYGVTVPQNEARIIPETLSLVFNEQSPDVLSDNILTPEALSILLDIYQTSVLTEIKITPETENILILLHAPFIKITNVEEIKQKPYLKPIYLIEITLKNNGPTLYLSDRNIQVSSLLYEDYLSSLSGIEDELRRADSGALNSDITLDFKNDKWRAYTYLIEAGDTYPFEGAECVLKETYLDAGNNPIGIETVFKGVLDEPYDIDLMSFKAKASSMLYAKDRLWKQDVIDTITYPNAYEDVGKVEPIVYGKDILMPALRTDWGAKTTLKADIIASSVSLELSDASRFPSSGSVWIDDEKIGYVSKSGNILNTLTRAQSGTTATSHRAGAETWEHKAQYDSLLASHELHSLGDIFAEIDRKLLRVTSGVSGVYENGKHKLRATEQIKVQAVKDDVGISQGSHGHSSPATQTRIPISASHGGNWFNWSGVDANVFDQSDITYLQGNNNTIDLGWGMITANFNAYTGPTPTAVYLCVTHTFSSSVVGAIPKIAGEGGLWIDLDASGVKVTQKVYFGTTVPTQVKYKGENNSTARNISFYVYEMWLEVHTSSTSSDPATGVAKTGGIIATRTVDRFHAVVSGYKDPDGKYGGIGSLIERPDLVIKHFLVQKMGFSFSEIDTMSFNKASVDYGILCSGAGFAFVIDSKIKPSEQLKRLAFECRSTVKYIKGMWYLDVLADTAPSALRTITYKELAGEGARFVFSKIPIYALANDLSAKFKKAYSKLGSESDWDGTSKITDSTSATKYGSYPKEFEFEFVRTQSMADNVLTHILKQRKMPYLVVSFPVFWEHFDLKVGDTIEIDNPLYDGKKFFIEEIRRDKAKAEVKAVEWW